MDALEKELASLKDAVKPRRVVTGLGETKVNPYLNDDAGAPLPPDPDSLFGQSKAYFAYKREKPEHRLMLWYRLQGYNVKETASLTGYTPQSVSQVCKQPWFVKAFCELSGELGKDAVTTFLEGEVMPALSRTVHLAEFAEAENVRLAANREILDRFLGKATVKVESKSSGRVDHVVHDVAKLQEQYKRNQEILASRGLHTQN